MVPVIRSMEGLKAHLDSTNTPDNPWQFYTVRYRRRGSKAVEYMIQMHLSQQQAIDCAAERFPDWEVIGATKPAPQAEPKSSLFTRFLYAIGWRK